MAKSRSFSCGLFRARRYATCLWGLLEPRGREVIAPPPFYFDQWNNPISTGCADYAHHITTRPPPLIFRPSYGPAVATVYRPLCVATDTVGQKTEKKAVILLLFFEMQFLSQKLNCCQGNLFKGGILIKTEGIYLCEMKLSIKCQNETKPGFQLVKLLLCQVFKKP